MFRRELERPHFVHHENYSTFLCSSNLHMHSAVVLNYGVSTSIHLWSLMCPNVADLEFAWLAPALSTRVKNLTCFPPVTLFLFACDSSLKFGSSEGCGSLAVNARSTIVFEIRVAEKCSKRDGKKHELHSIGVWIDPEWKGCQYWFQIFWNHRYKWSCVSCDTTDQNNEDLVATKCWKWRGPVLGSGDLKVAQFTAPKEVKS